MHNLDIFFNEFFHTRNIFQLEPSQSPNFV